MKKKLHASFEQDCREPTPAELRKAQMAVVRLSNNKTAFAFTLGAQDFITLMGNVSLALKHPKNQGDIARRMCRLWERMFDLVCQIQPDLQPIFKSMVLSMQKGGGK